MSKLDKTNIDELANTTGGNSNCIGYGIECSCKETTCTTLSYYPTQEEAQNAANEQNKLHYACKHTRRWHVVPIG